MDQLTHTLTAVALAHAGLKRTTRFATLALVVGVNLPDVDMLSRVAGSAVYLKYHRGITHSLLGVLILGALLAGVIYYFGRRQPESKHGPPLNARWLLGLSLIATASHLLLDFANAYGARPFLPFSARWYAWDVMPILDPVLLGLMIAGLGFAALLRLVSEEVGAKKPDYRRSAIFALTMLVLVLGLRDLARRRVVSLLDSHTYAQQAPQSVEAFPTPASPFTWTGVVETDSGFYVLEANALERGVDPDAARYFRKADPSPALDAATNTRTAAIFLDFARLPWAEVHETTEGSHVSMRDLRFLSLGSDQHAFVVDISLDRELRVRSESFKFSAAPRGAE